MEWKSNTGRIKVFPRIMGTPWDFQEPFCFYPWEPGTGLCISQSPPHWNPEAAQRNAKCQWSGCASTLRERESWRYKDLTSLCSVTLLWGLEVKLYSHCQRCPSPQTAKDHHWLTLISELRPGLKKQNVWKMVEKKNGVKPRLLKKNK